MALVAAWRYRSRSNSSLGRTLGCDKLGDDGVHSIVECSYCTELRLEGNDLRPPAGHFNYNFTRPKPE